ncbi:hypothetical protein J2S40_001147 [Nocardioides luteus]|nr:hypothetical protein [Nocardioides luteus]
MGRLMIALTYLIAVASLVTYARVFFGWSP